MNKKKLVILALGFLVILGLAAAQYMPWLYWTLLPMDQADEIIGEASGETALNTIIDINGYNRDRLSEEYAGPFLETQVILKKLKQYGLAGAEIVAYPGGETWDGVKGELWEVSPKHQKLASMRDMVPMLASGSSMTDVTGELVWVGRGTPAEIEAAKVEGKIVVTEGSLGGVHNIACLQKGALGVIGISMSRPYFDPLQMGWAGISSFRGMRGRQGQPSQPAQPETPPQPPPQPKFGFQLPVREGDILKQRLMVGQKITVRAQVESSREKYKLENVVAHIPGTDPNAGEIIFSATF